MDGKQYRFWLTVRSALIMVLRALDAHLGIPYSKRIIAEQEEPIEPKK